MSPLRICMLTTFYPPYSFGGDGITVQRLAQALVRHGHHVTVIHDTDAYRALAHDPIPERPDVDEDAGVTVIRLRSRLGALSPLLVQQFGRPMLHASRLRHLLRPGQFDVVNFHNVSLIGGPGLLTYSRDAVTLYMAHEHWLVCPTHVLWRNNRERCETQHCLQCVLMHRRPPQLWRYTGALPRAIEQVDTVIALSEFSRARHRAFGLTREMDVLPPFLPTEAPVAEAGAPPHQRPYFFFAGRLEKMKGLDDAIAAMRIVGNADMVVAGEGSERARWQAMAADLPHVHFVGQLAPEAVRIWQRHAIATLVPSVGYETFGVVLIEALREGTPVIARRIGPFPEIVAQAGAGALFDTPAELAAAMVRIHDDPALRRQMAVAAQDAVQSRWSEMAVLPAYLGFVHRAALRRGHARVAGLLDRVAS